MHSCYQKTRESTGKTRIRICSPRLLDRPEASKADPIYVSRDPLQSSCGIPVHWPVPFGEGEDECPNTNLYSLRSFKGELLQNVGNATYPSPDTSIQHPDKCRLYNVWSGEKFGSPETTEYSKHFKAAMPWIRP
jgi:hypothetical protein